MDAEQLAEFGHEVYQDAEGRWTCDHEDHDGSTEEFRHVMEKRCAWMAGEEYEDQLLRDGTHPSLTLDDGSGR